MFKRIKRVGERVQERVQQQGFTSEQIAECLHCTPVKVTEFYRGEAIPMYQHLVTLADVLNTSVTELIAAGYDNSVDVHTDD